MPDLFSTGQFGLGAILDVETTGLKSWRDEIVELAITLFRYDRSTGAVIEIAGQYSGLRQPSGSIPAEVIAIHGINDDMVRGHSLDEPAIRSLLDQAEFVIAHNVKFDRGFVERLLPWSRTLRWLCSRDGIDWRAKGHVSRSLEDLARGHRIRTPDAHRAEGDVATVLALLSYAPKNGQPYLRELLRTAGLLDVE
jgi:DNA polymerase III subunit epsilon